MKGIWSMKNNLMLVEKYYLLSKGLYEYKDGERPKKGYAATQKSNLEIVCKIMSNIISDMQGVYKGCDIERKLSFEKAREMTKAGNYAEALKYSSDAKELRGVMNYIKSKFEIYTDSLCKLGDIYSSEEDVDRAAVSYNEALKNHNEGLVELEVKTFDKISYKLGFKLLELYYSTGNTGYLGKAVDLYVDEISTYKDSWFLDEILGIGNKCFEVGLSDKALNCYLKLINPKLKYQGAYIAYCNIGDMCMNEGGVEDAISYYKEACQVSRHPIAYNKLYQANQVLIDQMREGLIAKSAVEVYLQEGSQSCGMQEVGVLDYGSSKLPTDINCVD